MNWQVVSGSWRHTANQTSPSQKNGCRHQARRNSPLLARYMSMDGGRPLSALAASTHPVSLDGLLPAEGPQKVSWIRGRGASCPYLIRHPQTFEAKQLMSRPRHYSPAIERFLVAVLYHEARHRKMPMTRLTNQLLKEALANSIGWQQATQLVALPSTCPAGK